MRNEHECKELLLDKAMTYFYYQNINNYAGYSWIFLKLKDLDSKILHSGKLGARTDIAIL